MLLIPVKIKFRSVEELIVLPLVLDVLLDDVLVDAHRGDEVASGPEGFLGRVSAFPRTLLVDANGRFSFEESHDVGNGVFWRDGDKQMNVVGTGVAFHDLRFFLFCQFSDDFADLDTNGTEEHFLPVFGYNHDVVFAVPHCVTR